MRETILCCCKLKLGCSCGKVLVCLRSASRYYRTEVTSLIARTMLAALTLPLLACLTSAANSAVLTDDSAFNGVVVALPTDTNAPDSHQQVLEVLQELLNETSQVLHRATGLRIGEVIFVIPPSWEQLVEKYHDIEVFQNADILVTSGEASVFGRRPYVLQYGGCGKAGLRIDLPLNFLLVQSPLKDVNKAKLMASEWIKHRYGVFDEKGFENDPRFPVHYGIHGREDVKITDCANVPVLYAFRDKSGNNCTLQVNQKTNKPNLDCLAHPEPDANDEVTSSLLYLQSLRNVDFLCGDAEHPHNSMSPNKQNVMCHRRSIWDVLKNHNDFKNRRIELGASDAPPPVFHFVKEKKNRIVLAIDDSVYLEKYKNLIKNAVANFIYSLPGGSKFGLTTAENEKLDTIPDSENLEELNNFGLKIELIFRKPEPCPQCVIQKAFQMLSSDAAQKSGTIVLISSGEPENLDPELLKNLESSNICLTAVLFHNASSDGYTKLFSSISCRRIYTISEGVSLKTLGQLYEALEHAIIPAISRKKATLMTKELNPNSPVVFAVDGTIETFDLWLSRESTEVDILKEDVKLTSESGVTPQIEKLITVKNFLLLRIPNETPTKWTCTLEYDSAVFLKIVVQFKDGDRLKAEAWLEDTTEEDSENQMPVILYARVFQGTHPLIQARVTAEIETPDGEKLIYDLLDNGLGDPDVTKNDGIYSRYFINFTTAGEYNVLISIDDNDKEAKIAKPGSAGSSCCGSELMIGQKESTESFYREMKLHFRARSGRPDNGYPPSEIMDLQLQKMTDKLYILKWTAPGGEKDFGRANKYTLKQFNTLDKSLNDMEQEAENTGFKWDSEKRPKNYGENEEMEIYITNETRKNESYFLSLISFSEMGEKSGMSNIVEIYLPPEIQTTTLSDDTTSPTTEDGSSTARKGNSLDSATIGYIVGTIVIIILVICAYLVFYFYTKRKAKQRKTDGINSQKSAPNGEEGLNNNDGSVSAKEWHLDRDPISPVNSIPATVLLYHHEQVKDAKRKHKDPPLFKLENLKENETQVGPTSIMNGVKPNTDQGQENPTYTDEEILENSVDYPSGNSIPSANSGNGAHPQKPSRKISNV